MTTSRSRGWRSACDMNSDWNEARAAAYDLVIATCGYEARARYLHSRFEGTATRFVVLDYGSVGVGSYDANREHFGRVAPAAWVDLRDPAFRTAIAGCVERALADADPDASACLRVLVDISSCSRSVLATLLLSLAHARARPLRLTCAYAVSEFFDPPDGELPSNVSEPVIGDLSGWSDDLSKPPCAIIGLGFEPGRALGSIDYLEVPEVRLFVPHGPDARFHQAVLAANALLLREAGEPVLAYDVRNPEDAYQKLLSLVSGLLPRFRPIIIPLGPKVFAALSMLLAIRLAPNVCIWRTSAGGDDDIADRGASGDVVVFDYDVHPRP